MAVSRQSLTQAVMTKFDPYGRQALGEGYDQAKPQLGAAFGKILQSEKAGYEHSQRGRLNRNIAADLAGGQTSPYERGVVPPDLAGGRAGGFQPYQVDAGSLEETGGTAEPEEETVEPGGEPEPGLAETGSKGTEEAGEEPGAEETEAEPEEGGEGTEEAAETEEGGEAPAPGEGGMEEGAEPEAAAEPSLPGPVAAVMPQKKNNMQRLGRLMKTTGYFMTKAGQGLNQAGRGIYAAGEAITPIPVVGWIFGPLLMGFGLLTQAAGMMARLIGPLLRAAGEAAQRTGDVQAALSNLRAQLSPGRIATKAIALAAKSTLKLMGSAAGFFVLFFLAIILLSVLVNISLSDVAANAAVNVLAEPEDPFWEGEGWR